MMEFIAHTEPDANIPSKNQDTYGFIPKYMFTGEYKKIPAKNPNQVEKHMGHADISLMNTQKLFKGVFGFSASRLMAFLGPLKMLP